MNQAKLDKALQYLQDNHNAAFASSYGEPGYSDPERGILFANWNNVPKGLQDWLEQCGYSLEWSDEWAEVGDKAYRTQADSYWWRPTAVLPAEWCEYLTPDDGADEAIEALQMTDHGHPCQAVPHWVSDVDLQDAGFVLTNDHCETGHHGGQADNPQAMARTAFDNGAEAVVFRITEASQFYNVWQCWARMPEPVFDRFDICAAHRQMEADYNVGGVLHERESNKRRNMSTGYQLDRMHYRPSPLGDMTPNAWAIYRTLQTRYGFTSTTEE